MKSFKRNYLLCFLLIAGLLKVHGAYCQKSTKPVTAIIFIESKGLIADGESVTFMTRNELEKTNLFEVIDRHETSDFLKKSGTEPQKCLGKSCLVATGKLMEADKMISGSLDRFGEKIIVTFKLLDVKTEVYEATSTLEYFNLQPELQRMIEISIKKLLNLETDAKVVNMLINFDAPIESPKTKIALNGPRMGATYVTGESGDVLQAPKGEGGFEMFPVSFQFGYQHEVQYLSSGNFQALIEFIGLIGGLESGRFVPSVSFLNGFRDNNSGLEFGFGPTLRIVKKQDGFYGDGNNQTEDKKWYTYGDPLFNTVRGMYPKESRLDSRGESRISTGLVFAVGKTFRSGYLNIPANLYVVPRKEGSQIGFSFGFNIYKKPRVQ